MKYTYFLLQSELLRRVSLCFVPGLRRTPPQTPISSLFDRLRAIAHSCSQQYDRLKSVFESYYLLEKPDPDDIRVRKMRDNWRYREAYVKICSLSLNLQSVLRESRRIETMLEDVNIRDVDYGRIVDSLDSGSERIRVEYQNCQRAVDDFARYVMSLRPSQPNPTESIPSMLAANGDDDDDDDGNKTAIKVGFTDFRANWPDEVFVGVSEADAKQTERTECDEGVANPCTKLLISELKMALRDKAKEWKQRERIALKNKLNADETSDSEDELPLIRKEKRTVRVDVPPAENPCLPPPPPPSLAVSSFASQIAAAAAASASWPIRGEEEHFSFGDDDTDDNDELS